MVPKPPGFRTVPPPRWTLSWWPEALLVLAGAAALIVVAALPGCFDPAFAEPPARGETTGTRLYWGGERAGDMREADLPTSAWEKPQCTGSRCTLRPLSAGDGGDGASPVIPFASCAPISGTDPVFLGPATCVDMAEARAQSRLRNPGSYNMLACALSGPIGAAPVTITARAGTCGATLSPSTLSCTVLAGAAACDSGGAGVLNATAGQCISLGVVPAGGWPADRMVNCTLERNG